jgi:hypothetical protein
MGAAIFVRIDLRALNFVIWLTGDLTKNLNHGEHRVIRGKPRRMAQA